MKERHCSGSLVKLVFIREAPGSEAERGPGTVHAVSSPGSPPWRGVGPLNHMDKLLTLDDDCISVWPSEMDLANQEPCCG